MSYTCQEKTNPRRVRCTLKCKPPYFKQQHFYLHDKVEFTWIICQGVSISDLACCLIKFDIAVEGPRPAASVLIPIVSASFLRRFLSARCLAWNSHFLFWNSSHFSLSSYKKKCVMWNLSPGQSRVQRFPNRQSYFFCSYPWARTSLPNGCFTLVKYSL